MWIQTDFIRLISMGFLSTHGYYGTDIRSRSKRVQCIARIRLVAYVHTYIRFGFLIARMFCRDARMRT